MDDLSEVDRLCAEAAAELAASEEAHTRQLDALIEEGSRVIAAKHSLEALQRHLETFAASGIVDLSERGIGHTLRDELDFTILGTSAGHIVALDLSSNLIESIPPRLLRPLTSLQVWSPLLHTRLHTHECFYPPMLSSYGGVCLMFASLAWQELTLSHNFLDEFPAALCALPNLVSSLRPSAHSPTW